MGGQGTFKEVRDGSGDPRGGPGRVGGHSERSKGPSVKSGTGQGTLGESHGEVRDI